MILDINKKKLKITSSQKLILISLTRYMDKEYQCFPSLRTLSIKTGFAVRTITTAITKFQELDYIHVGKKYSSHTHNVHNLYTINVRLLNSFNETEVIAFKKRA